MGASSSDCLFCKIADKKVESDIVFENEDVVAFKDINPQAPVHILIIPKKHIEKVSEIDAKDYELMGKLIGVANNVAKDKKLDEEGYRLVVNNGKKAGQAVFHLHLHLLGGRNFRWPPG